MIADEASHRHPTSGSADLLDIAATVARQATANLGDRSSIDWQELSADYDGIRDHIARVVPGFDDYNLRVRQPGGFHLVSPVAERIFKTPSGRALFTIHKLPEHYLRPDQFLMMTM